MMIEYFTLLSQRSKTFIEDVTKVLPSELGKQEFLQALGPKWYAAYRVRGNICPEKAKLG